MLLVILLIIIYGLLEIFAKDFMWKISSFWGTRKFWLRTGGLYTGRTKSWDNTTTIYGIFLIIGALVLGYILFKGS